MLVATANGSVSLYHNSNKKLETSSSGVSVTGNVVVSGTVDGRDLASDGSKLDGIAAGANNITNNNQLTNGDGYITSASDGTKLPLSGGELSGDLITHNVRPDGNGNRNLGTSSYRWANIYTSDLNLSNEGGKNDVDGTWGSFTLQEGAESLFLINKRNGKKYKINLTEVS